MSTPQKDSYYDNFRVNGLSREDNQALVSDLKRLDMDYFQVSILWKHGLHNALQNPSRWAAHDLTIQRSLDEYRQRLKYTNIPNIDWELVKVVLWVESGAGEKNLAWFRKPMQIGNLGDAGLDVVFNGREKIDIILPAELRKGITERDVENNPQINIKFGLAYLLNRLCESEITSQPDMESSVFNYEVKPGDSLAGIAKQSDSSVNHIKYINGLISEDIKPNMVLRVQRVITGRKITRWKSINFENISAYNGAGKGAGDSLYKQKLMFAYGILKLSQKYRLTMP